jgi:hypothetical protein
MVRFAKNLYFHDNSRNLRGGGGSSSHYAKSDSRMQLFSIFISFPHWFLQKAKGDFRENTSSGTRLVDTRKLILREEQFLC